MKNLIRRALARRHPFEPQNRVILDAAKLRENFQILRGKIAAEPLPVVKSNAYGHGLREVVQVLENENFSMRAVDSFPEFQVVKSLSTKKILVMGETAPENYRFVDHKIAEIVVGSWPVLRALAASGRARKIHLFVQTGMNREGRDRAEFAAVLDFVGKSKNLAVTGLMSHCHSGNEESVKNQVVEFEKFLGAVRAAGRNPAWVQLGASKSQRRIEKTLGKNARTTAWRPGSALRGLRYPGAEKLESFVRTGPVLRVESKIGKIRKIPAGAGVGYDHARVAEQDSWIVVVPRGYAEGLPRAATSRNLCARVKFLGENSGKIQSFAEEKSWWEKSGENFGAKKIRTEDGHQNFEKKKGKIEKSFGEDFRVENLGDFAGLEKIEREKIRASWGEERAISRGKVSMNLSTREVSPAVAEKILAGQTAVLELLGTERRAPNSAMARARAADTIPLEITTRFAQGLRREIENF